MGTPAAAATSAEPVDRFQAAGGIAAGPDDIGRKTSADDRSAARQRAHRRCQPAQLFGRFALGAQCHQQGRSNRRRTAPHRSACA
jgi:hypothetical protein